jgi:hypothetical protein
MTKPHHETILEMFDAGKTPVQIIEAGVSKRVVYAVLRRERPGRARAPRTRVSKVPAQVRRMAAAGLGVARIAELLRVTQVYVYRILAERG